VEHIIKFLDKLITQFTWRRLFFVLTLLFLVIVCLTIFELYTSHFRLSRLERSATLLSALLEQSEQVGKTDNKSISEIHEQLVTELKASIGGTTTELSVPTWVLKAGASIVPWLLLGVIMYFVTDDGFSTVIGGMLMITIPVAFIGAIIPDFESQWINYLAYPIGAFALIMVPMFLYGQRESSSEKSN